MLMNSSITSPVNFGNPDEQTILDLSRFVLKLIPGGCETVDAVDDADLVFVVVARQR